MKVHLNGSLVPQSEARVSAFDRGFLFGDGVYEMVRFFGGVGVAMDLHVARLARSLELTGIRGFAATELERISHELLHANGLRQGLFNCQTRALTFRVRVGHMVRIGTFAVAT